MSALLDKLPKKAGRTGWPWDEQFNAPDSFTGVLPKISIIVPSFNQGRYLEETIRSVVLQGYSNYELLIIDAGSTDETLEVIREYEQWITYWVSEKDRGQSHAILKGLDRVNGAIVNWINSDDMCAPGAFYAIAKEFDLNKYDVLCGRCNFIEDTIDNIVLRDERMGVSEDVGITLITKNINQPSAFFRTDVMKQLRVNEEFHYAMDLDLWFRYIITRGQGRVRLVEDLLTYFRWHNASKSIAQGYKFQSDIDKVYYNILLGAKQDKIILDFVKHGIDNFDEFTPESYVISIPIEELYSFFSHIIYSAAQFYYQEDEYVKSRQALSLGLFYDKNKKYNNIHKSLSKRLSFPDLVISTLKFFKKQLRAS